MMIHFQPYITLIMLFFFIFFFLLGSMAAQRHNPLLELSRDDLASLAGYGEEKLSTVVVRGTLLCDAFFHRSSRPFHSHPIPGASVGVTCDTNRKTTNWTRGKTDQYGDFLIDLPSHLHAIPNMEKRCLVRILHLPRKSPCHRAFTGKHTAAGIKLSSSGNGIRTYSTHGPIHLTHKHPHPFMNIRSRRGRKTVHML